MYLTNPSLANDQVKTQEVFVNGLRQAAATLWIARFRIALLVSAVQSIQIAGATVACVALVTFLLRLSLVPASLLICVVFIGAISILLVFGINILPHAFNKADLRDAAERLDMATNGRNGISTALELCNKPSHTPFENQAINDGVEQLARVKGDQPVIPDARVEYSWRWGILPGACVLLFAALMVPAVARTPIIQPSVQQTAWIAPPVLTKIAHQAPTEELRRDPSVQPVHSIPQATKFADNQQIQNLIAQNTSASATDNGIGASSATSSALASPPEENAGLGQPSPKSEQGSKTTLLANSLEASKTPNAPKSGSQGQTQSPPRSGESGSKSSASKGGSSKGDDDSNSASSGGAGASSQKDPKSSQGGSGSSSGESGSPPPKGSSGSSLTGSNSTEAGGDGKSGGQNPPKKSRGVTPMMLGTNEPDLFEGKQLPGPDKRTTSQLPPPKDPGQLAINAAAASRTSDEQPVDRYSVPAEMRGIAGRYFQSFHEDLDKAVTAAANDSK